MPDHYEISELLQKLTKDLDFTKDLIIGIDGYDGSGKTTLANSIQDKFPATVISVDDFIEKNKDSYVPALDVHRLRSTIENCKGVVILEGVCLLSVTERLGISLSCHIYIKRLTEMGLWCDEEECTPQFNPDNLIEKLEKELAMFNSFLSNKPDNDSGKPVAILSGLRKEIIHYHSQHNPVEAADYVVERKST